MANFQESGIFGMSPRTVWISLIVAGAVVGLFFIPGTVKFLVSNRNTRPPQPAQTTAPAQSASVATSPSARSALSPLALHRISETLDSTGDTQVKGQPKKKTDVGESKNEGFFSGWDFQVKAGGVNSSNIAIPAGLTLERLGSREAQTFFKRSRPSVVRFQKQRFSKMGEGREAISSFLTAIDAVIKGIPKGGPEEKELAKIMTEQHVTTLRVLSANGADRGALLEWLSIPVVRFIDSSAEVHALEKVNEIFKPHVVLRSVNIRQKGRGIDPASGRLKATLQAEVAVKGSDVESVSVFANGKPLRDVRPPRPDATGYRVFQVRGDATGVWSFVVNDKYGAPAYQKSYAFYPRVYRFRQKRDGSFDVAFRADSAPNSLDRYFFVGARGGSNGSSSGSGMSKF